MIVGAPTGAHIPSRCTVGAVHGGRCTNMMVRAMTGARFNGRCRTIATEDGKSHDRCQI